MSPSVSLAQNARDEFLRLINRPRVPAAVAVQWQKTVSDNAGLPLEQTGFTFASEAGQRVPVLLVQRSNAGSKRPVVIVMHGTGGTKADQLPLLNTLASKGFIAIAIDGRYHGERIPSGKGSTEYQEAIFRAWQNRGAREHPFFYDTAWDIMRLIDHLETRPDVDKARIGLYGVSKGGIEAYLTAAADTRVAAVVPCIAVQSFNWALEHDAWQSRVGTIQTAFDAAAREAGIAKPGADFVRDFYARVVPGIDRQFDGPAMVPLIAPRPLMIINGETDDRTPLPGVQLCIDATKTAYAAHHAEDRLAVRIQPATGHTVTAESQSAAIRWLVKWLKP